MQCIMQQATAGILVLFAHRWYLQAQLLKAEWTSTLVSKRVRSYVVVVIQTKVVLSWEIFAVDLMVSISSKFA